MFQPDELIEQINNLDHGAPRLGAIQSAFADADAAAAHNWRLFFRFEYIRESIFHDDAYKAIICFPEFLAIYDEHGELHDEFEDDMMQAFKWVIENVQEFYQVSREDIDRYFAEYRRRCEHLGYSLRVYYMKLCRFLMRSDGEELPRVYEQFHRAKRDRISDCEACEANFDMEIALHLGDTEKALKIAAPILQGEKRCAEVPHKTYSTLAEHYLYRGDLDEAQYYAALCERWTQLRPEFLYDTGTLLEVASVMDPQHGWTMLKHTLSDYMASRNPESRLNYARGAYRLLHTVTQLHDDLEEDDNYTLNAIFRQLPLDFTEKGMSMVEMEQWFYAQTKEASERLDERNHARHYQNILETELHFAGSEESPADDTPKGRPHGLVRRNMAAFVAGFAEDTLPSPEVLAERFRAWLPEEAELLSCVPEEGEFSCSLRIEERICDFTFRRLDKVPPAPFRPVAGMEEETVKELVTHPAYLILTEYGEDPTEDFGRAVSIADALFPEMLGFADLMTLHAYPMNWVRFVAKHPAAVTPNDMYGLNLSQDRETQEIWMCTIGLSCMGLRDLEVIGSAMENYGIMANVLDEVTAQVAGNGFLPEPGVQFGRCRVGQTLCRFTWRESGQSGEAQMGELLICPEDGEPTPLPEFEPLLEAGDADFPQTNEEFYRRRALARQTFHILLRLLDQPHDVAAVRIEIELDDEKTKEFGYRYETLWTDGAERNGDTITAKATGTPDALPDMKEGDVLSIRQEDVLGWYVEPAGSDAAITENTAFIVEGEDS